MSTTYYRARCGSLYRVTYTPARAASKTKPARPASTMQARRSTHANTFSPAYPTTSAEVARMVSYGTFTEVTDP
jgi:hypothetical protein